MEKSGALIYPPPFMLETRWTWTVDDNKKAAPHNEGRDEMTRAWDGLLSPSLIIGFPYIPY